MVPGLDLDYEATADDEPVESSYVQSPVRREMPGASGEGKRNYDWLVEIVDEETGPMQAITDFDQPQSTQRRFVFSRQPAWLRTPTETVADDDDFELPEWLQ
jgi:hypothetical protein